MKTNQSLNTSVSDNASSTLEVLRKQYLKIIQERAIFLNKENGGSESNFKTALIPQNS